MWSILGAGTAVTCWFCNEKTRLPRSPSDCDTKHNWHCDHCQNQNVRDRNGNIVDSHPDMYRESPIPARAQLPEHEPTQQLFCSSCQRNQELICQILSAYLPDEDDPEYQDRYEHAEEYEQSLKRRYPVVCRSCQVKVDQRLQQQSQWMYRRELASALHRSESARKFAPHMRPQPTLRRKRLVAMWALCALVALVACPLVTWAFYLCILCGYLRPGGYATGVGLLLALLTHLSRALNPLWLYIASNPGVRAAGLPTYKQRVVHLALLRLLAAILQIPGWHPVFWSSILICDLVLYWRAISCLRTLDSRRPASRLNRPLTDRGNSAEQEPVDTSPVVTERDAQQTLMSLKSLSFGDSEANLDQDDSLFGSAFTSATSNPWGRRPSSAVRRGRRYGVGADSSDDDTAVNGDMMSDLNTLSFGAPTKAKAPTTHSSSLDDELAALLGGGGSSQSRVKTNSSNSGMFARAQASRMTTQEQRPFEAFAFNRSVDTGLESKMSAFSLDDGSYQGLFGSSAMDSRLLSALQKLLSPGAIVGACIVGSWVAGAYIPLLVIWLVRLALLGVVAASLVFAPRQPALVRACSYALVLALVCLPLWLTTRPLEPAEDDLRADIEFGLSGTRLSRWPLAKRLLSQQLYQHTSDGRTSDDADWTEYPPVIETPVPEIPLPIKLDSAAELAVLAVLAFT
ncbi:hypothetical protein IWW55_000492 [Coemansia sp. RSA 2706]|nr:hypothetical protein IWW55_000492 [Coemansia sp. RSA 2706]KAJ2393507.1 hypothetical protein H4S02_000169 [Coemansia sp. RSA 2611]